MSDPISWLPDLVRFEDFDGNWLRYIEAVYGHFKADFVTSSPTWPDRRWAMKRQPEYDGKEATFWHIVSEGVTEDSRTPDLRRCERVRWPRPMIDTANAGRVRMWKNKRDRSERVILAPEDYSYVVVLEDRQTFIMLWTAYPVAREHQRKKLKAEHDAFQASENG